MLVTAKLNAVKEEIEHGVAGVHQVGFDV